MSRPQQHRASSALLLPLVVFSLLGVGEAHEASCHVCTGTREVANVMKSACQLLVFKADSIADGESNECRAIQYQGVIESCCPTNPSSFCNLCEDGGKLPNPKAKISTLTCEEAGGFASFSQNVPDCEHFQASTGVYCGCDNPVASSTACRICGGDNLLPDPSLQVDSSSVFGGRPTRACSALEYFAQFSTDRLDGCSAYQDAFADACCVGLETDSPTPQPSPVPSKSPTTPQPTILPTTSQPSASPLTAQPTKSPSTAQPTKSPSTAQPTKSPTTPQPTKSPTTPQPFEMPTTPQPIEVQATFHPLGAPTTPQPFGLPTLPQSFELPTTPQPIEVLTTPKPFEVPMTPEQLELPTTPQPFELPMTPPSLESPKRPASSFFPVFVPVPTPTIVIVPISFLGTPIFTPTTPGPMLSPIGAPTTTPALPRMSPEAAPVPSGSQTTTSRPTPKQSLLGEVKVTLRPSPTVDAIPATFTPLSMFNPTTPSFVDIRDVTQTFTLTTPNSPQPSPSSSKLPTTSQPSKTSITFLLGTAEPAATSAPSFVRIPLNFVNTAKKATKDSTTSAPTMPAVIDFEPPSVSETKATTDSPTSSAPTMPTVVTLDFGQPVV